MRRLLFSSTWLGLLGVLATAGVAAADGDAPACAGATCCARHAGHCGNPCAQSFRYDRLPLPPIAFSRYADNGDYACTKAVFCDGRPKHPWAEAFWYGYRQPYPLPHSVLRDSPRPELLNPGPPIAGPAAGN
jgi:hypothetical protein